MEQCVSSTGAISTNANAPLYFRLASRLARRGSCSSRSNAQSDAKAMRKAKTGRQCQKPRNSANQDGYRWTGAGLDYTHCTYFIVSALGRCAENVEHLSSTCRRLRTQQQCLLQYGTTMQGLRVDLTKQVRYNLSVVCHIFSSGGASFSDYLR